MIWVGVFVCLLTSQSEEFRVLVTLESLISYFSSPKPITEACIILAYNPLHYIHLKVLNLYLNKTTGTYQTALLAGRDLLNKLMKAIFNEFTLKLKQTL